MATCVLETSITTSTIARQLELPQRTQRAERIVVVEDDRALQKILQRLFSSQGFEVTVVQDARACVDLLRKQTASALVLDLERLRSPKSDLCQEISRTIPHVPFVILSTSSDVAEKVLLLELGADDYVTIPFSPHELVARVRALIRRTGHSNSELRYAFEDVKVDCSGMEVTRRGEAVQLTIKEFQTLQYLVKNANRVISRDELLNQVWGYHSYPCTRTVDNHILKLRQKLEDTPSRPSHFLTTHGVGYKFVP
jgi:DNA-binding response OmpR family regulator